MLRMTGWVIGGLCTMALWIPEVGALPDGSFNRVLCHDWRHVRHDRYVRW